MKKIVIITMVLFVVVALTACGGGNDSTQTQAQQTQISSLQTQLAAVQSQLSTATSQGQVDSSAIDAVIALLTQTQSTLAQLVALELPADNVKFQQRAAALTTASNQILVLQSLADSLAASSQSLASAYHTALASIASLTSQLNVANAQVATLTTQLAASQSSNSTLTTQLAAANGQVTTLNGQIATLTSTAASLQTQLDNANSTIATRDATIATLNSTIATLNAQINAMVATPVPMSVSALTAAVSTNITVTANFPISQAGQLVTFSTTGGSLTTSSTYIAGNGKATTTFNSGSAGTFNIYAVKGLFAGGVVVTITPTPAPTYSISGTVTLNSGAATGVIVALTGSATGVAITNASGNYSFTGLHTGSYTVTPLLAYYYLPIPDSHFVMITNANTTGIDFCNRWHNNNNGTITDMSTGLVWLKNANCAGRISGWGNAGTWVAHLASGACGLTDGSVATNWRLPTDNDMWTLTTGNEAVLSSTPGGFSNIQDWGYGYWTSTYSSPTVVVVFMEYGEHRWADSSFEEYVWPVRSGP